MMNIRKVSAATLTLISSLLTGNAQPGSEVILVYNTRVPESKQVAEHYAQQRQVPKNQIFGFALSTADEMSRHEFRNSLQKPLARALEKNKLWEIGSEIVRGTNGQPARMYWRVKQSKIRYAVLCYGVPFRIASDPNVKEPEAEQMQPELRRNEAAVDSELALLPLMETHLPLSGVIRNPVYGVTNQAAFHPTNGILMVARLDGPTAAIARGLVDKAIHAETTGLWGRAYFDVRKVSDTNYKMGDDWISGAAELCRQLGFETVIDEKPGTFPAEFPMSHIAFYAGWYDGDVSGPFARPTVEFMPGAFAYHLHSYSAAQLRSPSRNWVGPLLAKGATISMGSVAEPYLAGTPDITIFAARLIYFGFSFGEAAYASQSTLSWQTTVVGDPLYRPFGKPAQELHQELAASGNKLIEWSYLRLMNLNAAKGLPLAQLAAALEQTPATKQSAVLSEKMADLYSTLGKPSSATGYWERALSLNPSPQQRLRIRLNLADKLLSLDRTSEAIAELKKVLQENPDYPARTALQERLLSLQQNLEKKEAAAATSAEQAAGN